MLSEYMNLVIEGPSEGRRGGWVFLSKHKELFQQCKMTRFFLPLQKRFSLQKKNTLPESDTVKLPPYVLCTIAETQLNWKDTFSPKLHAANSYGSPGLVAGSVWESHLVKPLRNSVKVFFHSLPDKVVICCIVIGKGLLVIVVFVAPRSPKVGTGLAVVELLGAHTRRDLCLCGSTPIILELIRIESVGFFFQMRNWNRWERLKELETKHIIPSHDFLSRTVLCLLYLECLWWAVCTLVYVLCSSPL